MVFTFMAIRAFWKQAPEVSETAKRFVDVQQGVPGQPLPPPALPTSVPLHTKNPIVLIYDVGLTVMICQRFHKGICRVPLKWGHQDI